MGDRYATFFLPDKHDLLPTNHVGFREQVNMAHQSIDLIALADEPAMNTSRIELSDRNQEKHETASPAVDAMTRRVRT